jgi:hypothetical protein
MRGSAVVVSSILGDLEDLDKLRDMAPSDVARQSRRLRVLIEDIIGAPLPADPHHRRTK